jgi:adenylyltransferase/sulfurtransferase
VDLAPLAARLRAHGEVSINEFVLRAHITDGNNSYEITLFTDGRAIIKGTQDEKIARAVYARYIGS